MSEIKRVDGTLSLGKFKAGSVGLTIVSKPSYAEYEAAAEMIGRMVKSSPWWIGDLLNIGEAAYGEKYTQALECTGLDEGTLRTYKYVAHQVETSIRMDNLSFTHHSLVASCDPKDQKKWLALALENNWTVAELRKAMRGGEEEGTEDEGGDDLVEVMHDIETYLNTLDSDSERLAAVKGLERRMKKLEKKYGGTA